MSSLLVHTAASRGIQPSQSRGLLRFEQPLVCAMGSVVVGEITHLAHPMPSKIRRYLAVCLLMGCRRCCSCQKPCISKVRQPCLAMSAHASSLGRLSWSPPGPHRAPPGPHCIPTWSPPGPRSGWSTPGPHLVVSTWSPPGPTWSPPCPHRAPPGPHRVPTWSPRGPHVFFAWAPGENLAGTRWEPRGDQVGARWEPRGDQVGTRWDPGGDQVGTRWEPGGSQVRTRRKPRKTLKFRKSVQRGSDVQLDYASEIIPATPP